MLVIHPDECIDCGACVPECPAEAIVADTEPEAEPRWLELNAKFSDIWPNIVNKGEFFAEADSFNGKSEKFTNFSEKPGSGD